ncbi:DegT/DnrJ/EryC1/StrS family aminotransferase [Aestuariibacter halophilus]|uniref:DegT/DnrJ/EryC1/StrS family aminotransferase n=1 Tax=Fluctibacter halophilus TaxID=226011 RepID=A0ABS8G3W8_9ALTE|nr:DegT/DnrJ/EryC1/StrS family aminotransferase [Aestuariibacter halophilus]MCC2614816.1 DegT/DnrJ/EryC1/StrS family aminotransferase [Aestuariibacter halophilus]
MIPIVKPFLPDIGRYQSYLDDIYARTWLTNNGPLVQELETRLAEYLGVEHLLLVANGTLALQVAFRTFGLEEGEAITTPFTFAATPGALRWQNLQPRFADICPDSLNIAPDCVENLITETTRAIVPVHVFGNPCDVERLSTIAQRHGLKVIYDAAHAFACQYKGQTVLQHGDAATLSLHATKMFHCVEGGAIIFKEREALEKARQLINFGFDRHNVPAHVGINAKMSELHAAMGLAMLDIFPEILAHRQALMQAYQQQLSGWVTFQEWSKDSRNNGAYAPIILPSEAHVFAVMDALQAVNIQSRRYFYPNLAEVSVYGDEGICPTSADISRRILCLPLFANMTFEEVSTVSETVKKALS